MDGSGAAVSGIRRWLRKLVKTTLLEEANELQRETREFNTLLNILRETRGMGWRKNTPKRSGFRSEHQSGQSKHADSNVETFTIRNGSRSCVPDGKQSLTYPFDQ